MLLLQSPTDLPPPIPFDPNQLTPLIGMIGGMVIAGIVLWAFFKSDIASALAERIRGRKKSSEAIEGVDAGHVAELEQRVSEVRTGSVAIEAWASVRELLAERWRRLK